VEKNKITLGELDQESQNWLRRALHNETISGALLLVCAAIALGLANSPFAQSYFDLSKTVVGPEALNLDLTLSKWAADGLLAIFFFVAGMELKHELVLGSLSNRANAAVPIAAALGGMIAPAAIYYAINAGLSTSKGWGIPMATDIAFALAVLAVAGRRLPIELRAFLLSLAVVDDLGAIIVIAFFYSSEIIFGQLGLGILCIIAFALAQRKRIKTSFVYVPLALLSWYFIHESGVHATIAGVTLGLLMRVRNDDGESMSPVDRMLKKVHPWSAGLCVPLFAFFAAGVSVVGISIMDAFTAEVSLGVILGLVVGKPLGILGFAWLVARLTRAELSSALYWWDIFAVGLLAGVGFTVSLLVTQLAFETGTLDNSLARLAVLIASVISALLAAAVLMRRRKVHSNNAN
jgi:NhaA family Na+:H+ antiporter